MRISLPSGHFGASDTAALFSGVIDENAACPAGGPGLEDKGRLLYFRFFKNLIFFVSYDNQITS